MLVLVTDWNLYNKNWSNPRSFCDRLPALLIPSWQFFFYSDSVSLPPLSNSSFRFDNNLSSKLLCLYIVFLCRTHLSHFFFGYFYFYFSLILLRIVCFRHFLLFVFFEFLPLLFYYLIIVCSIKDFLQKFSVVILLVCVFLCPFYNVLLHIVIATY